MHVAVEDNPNCEGAPEQVFAELGPPRPVAGLWIEDRGQRRRWDIVGVAPGARWVAAHAVKVNDSSEGHAFLITGGEWGIRLRPADEAGAWDLDDRRQKGEPFKLYGDHNDLIYADV